MNQNNGLPATWPDVGQKST